MKLASLFVPICAAILFSQAALAMPPMHTGTTEYKSYYYYANEPFEVRITGQTDLCQEVSLVGSFAQLKFPRPLEANLQTWVAEFSANPVFGACRTETPRQIRAQETLKITPKKGQEHFQFFVPAELTLEIR